MKTSSRNTYLIRQRITLLLAMLFCLLISGVEYFPHGEVSTKTEQNADNPEQTFLNVAVDAVVPFALQVMDTVFYFIYQLFSFELKLRSVPSISASIPQAWVEILFERIISTKGP